MFRNERIEKRLVKSFAVVTILTAVAAVIGLIALLVTSNRYAYALQNYGFSQGDIGKMMVTFADTRSATRAVIGYTDAEIVASSLETHNQKKEACLGYFKDMEKTLSTAEEKTKYEEISKSLDEYWVLEEQILNIGNTTDAAKSAEAQEMAAHELAPIYDATYALLADLM
ncbi:MAG TPA: methyl-accepting chemotaxis protein, partial [Lachnospiraceae bacterium]|nr:methyl-accepting chemotaxis protein [Lachnospiraceae bacterium]